MVVGGIAVVLHGHVRPVVDLDLVNIPLNELWGDSEQKVVGNSVVRVASMRTFASLQADEVARKIC